MVSANLICDHENFMINGWTNAVSTHLRRLTLDDPSVSRRFLFVCRLELFEWVCWLFRNQINEFSSLLPKLDVSSSCWISDFALENFLRIANQAKICQLWFVCSACHKTFQTLRGNSEVTRSTEFVWYTFRSIFKLFNLVTFRTSKLEGSNFELQNNVSKSSAHFVVKWEILLSFEIKFRFLTIAFQALFSALKFRNISELFLNVFFCCVFYCEPNSSEALQVDSDQNLPGSFKSKSSENILYQLKQSGTLRLVCRQWKAGGRFPDPKRSGGTGTSIRLRSDGHPIIARSNSGTRWASRSSISVWPLQDDQAVVPRPNQSGRLSAQRADGKSDAVHMPAGGSTKPV